MMKTLDVQNESCFKQGERVICHQIPDACHWLSISEGTVYVMAEDSYIHTDGVEYVIVVEDDDYTPETHYHAAWFVRAE